MFACRFRLFATPGLFPNARIISSARAFTSLGLFELANLIETPRKIAERPRLPPLVTNRFEERERALRAVVLAFARGKQTERTPQLSRYLRVRRLVKARLRKADPIAPLHREPAIPPKRIQCSGYSTT